MTNYEIIKKYLEHGFKVKCQLSTTEWTIFTSVMSNGMLRHSKFSPFTKEVTTLKDCQDTLGETYSDQNGINGLKLLSITPIIEKPKMYEVGDLVDIAEEFMTDNVLSKVFIDLKGNKVTGCPPAGFINIKSPCDSNSYMFPRWAVYPHIPEQDDEVADILKVINMLYPLPNRHSVGLNEAEIITKAIEMLKKIKVVK